MKFLLSCVLPLIAAAAFAATPDEARLALTELWGKPSQMEQHTIGGGLVLQRYSFAVAGRRQVFSLLLADTDKVEFSLAGVNRPPLRTVPEFAVAAQADAAVNGGYFNPDGTPIGVLKISGRELGRERLDSGGMLILKPNGAWGGIVPSVLGADSSNPDALECSPLLLRGGDGPLFTSNARYPRTAVGIGADGVAVFVVSDGKLPGAADGLRLEELVSLFLALKCTEALCLDGGGSSTLYVKDFSASGVVNHPSDNHRFDHEGVRRVASAIIMRAAPETEPPEIPAPAGINISREIWYTDPAFSR